MDEALRNAERASDDLALGLALYLKAGALWNQGAAQRQIALELCGRVREMASDGRFYSMMLPVFNLRFAEHRASCGDRNAVPLLLAGIEQLHDIGLVSYYPWATEILVEGLLRGGTDDELREADAAIERLAAESALQGSSFSELVLLKSRALLPTLSTRRRGLPRLRHPLP